MYVGSISTVLLRNSNKIPLLRGPGAWDCEWRRWSFPPTQAHWFCTESERKNQISALWHFLWKTPPTLCLFIYCVWKLRMTLIKFQVIYLLSSATIYYLWKVFTDGNGPKLLECVREMNCYEIPTACPSQWQDVICSVWPLFYLFLYIMLVSQEAS